MLASGGSPNLIQGVSRQSPAVRLTGQLEDSLNQFPTVTRGLVPRNPTILSGVIEGVPSGAVAHIVERDDTERYVMSFWGTGVAVNTLDGTSLTVNAPGGYGYLSGATADDIDVMTVADHTFVLNKAKTVAALPALMGGVNQGGLVHIVQGDYNTTYTIRVNGAVVAKLTTFGGGSSDGDAVRAMERGATVQAIARMLFSGAPPTELAPTLPAAADANLVANLPAAVWDLALMDNVIHIKRKDGAPFTLTVDAGSDHRIRAHKDTAPVYTELPRLAPNGFTIRVSGSESSSYDDYYVRFEKPAGVAEGSWKEICAPGIPYMLDPGTMPHILVREADGTFTFKQATWGSRKVGDELTAPWPSFVNHKISGMCFGRNRLGFYSGESIVFSRHNSFYEFFRESILTSLDTDPVDLTIAHDEISDITGAVNYGGDLILFTSSVPFRLNSGDTLTPKNGRFDPILSTKVRANCAPVVSGDRLFFTSEAPSGTLFYEFTYDRDVGVKEAPCITEHVQGYIPNNVRQLAAWDGLNLLVARTAAEPTALYTYKWLWVGQQKVQSAWQKWSIPDPIVAIRFVSEELVIVTQRGAEREILRLNCHEAWQDAAGPTLYLDRRIDSVTGGTYDPMTDTTTWEFTRPLGTGRLIVSSGDMRGVMPEQLTRTTYTATCRGNFGGDSAHVGDLYDSYGYLSEICMRPSNNQGGYGNGTPGVEVWLASLAFRCDDTSFLHVTLERDYRQPYTYKLSSALLGTKTGKVGAVALGNIPKTLSIRGKADETRIRFGAPGPYPYSVTSYSWTGRAAPYSL